MNEWETEMAAPESQADHSSSSSSSDYLEKLLEKARPFIREELEKIDVKLPSLVGVLRSVGAGECWHKHGSFLHHLVDIFRILYLWAAPHSICLCGLFHSAYSNSYVNLAIFHPSTGRERVRSYVGDAAERLIHLFCIVPRHALIHDRLLFHYTDADLTLHLHQYSVGLSSEWREKLNSVVPAEGLVVQHIRTGEEVRVSRRVLAVFLLMTMADFSDQLFSFQDQLFDNSNGRLEFAGNNFQALWPGDGKPGLWLNSISRMGALYTLIVREEEIMMQERERERERKAEADHVINEEVVVENEGRDEDVELVIPPVFHRCTKVLGAAEQIEARDLYWEAVCEYGKIGLDKAEELLLKSIQKNPFVGEPRLVLAHLYLGSTQFEAAQREAEEGLRLLLEWGSPWDKRMSWEGWVAWARVLLMNSKQRSWPHTSFGILNLGLVT